MTDRKAGLPPGAEGFGSESLRRPIGRSPRAASASNRKARKGSHVNSHGGSDWLVPGDDYLTDEAMLAKWTETIKIDWFGGNNRGNKGVRLGEVYTVSIGKGTGKSKINVRDFVKKLK